MNYISASIVLYHTEKEQLLKAVNSVLNTSLNVRLYLVDNSSNDDLKELARLDDRIEYIYNNANLGYGAAHNIAIRKSIEADVPFHLVLNPDVYFAKGTLEALHEYSLSQPDVGLVMPKVTNPDGSIQYLCKLLPTPLDLIGRRFLPEKVIQRRNEHYELRFCGYNRIMEVPFLSGSFMFMRVSILKKVGLFDERYFMYAEDVDLSRRINEASQTIFYPYVSVVHEHAKESYKSPKMLFIHIKNIVKYFNKWGWFFDTKRKETNQRIIKQLNEQQS
jgi:GT2 family glycosyltransferase